MAEKQRPEAPSLPFLAELVALYDQIVKFSSIHDEVAHDLDEGDIEISDQDFEALVQKRLLPQVQEIRTQFQRVQAIGFPHDELRERAKLYKPKDVNAPQFAYDRICDNVDSLKETYQDLAAEVGKSLDILDGGGYLDHGAFETCELDAYELLSSLAEFARDYKNMRSQSDYEKLGAVFGVDLDDETPARWREPHTFPGMEGF